MMINRIWRKSSQSGGLEHSDCVELADLAEAVGVRDSKDPYGPILKLARPELAALLNTIKSGKHQP